LQYGFLSSGGTIVPNSGLPLPGNAVDVDEILRQYDRYIVALARKELPHIAMHTDVLEDDIDEIAQMARIKLSSALRKGPIGNLNAYVKKIVRSQRIDLLRKYKYTLPIIIDEEGEIQQGKVLFLYNRDSSDPAQELEQQQQFTHIVEKMVEEVLKLPRKQQYAFICLLKDHASETLPLLCALVQHGIDVESAQWSKKPGERQSQRSSLSMARKKLLAARKDWSAS
jgi:DNA-directed RNA polymerase specialized sigma24 family protein